MKDMKNRIIALILVVIMSVLALSSCGCYDFADEDITYASFDYAAFKDALGKIEIEDGEFTTDEATRLKITAAKVYNAVVDKIIAAAKEEDRNTTMSGDDALTNGDVLYFVYYATLGEQVFFGSQMNMTTLTSSSDKANHVVRLDNYYNEKTNTLAYLIQQEVLKMIENGDAFNAYSTKTKAELEADFVEEWKAAHNNMTYEEAEAIHEKEYKLENPEATEEQVKAAVAAFKAEYTQAKKDAIKVQAGKTYYVSYTRKYETPKLNEDGSEMTDADGNTIYETITEKVAYEALTLSATHILYNTLLNEKATACVGDTAFAAFIKAEGEGENETITTSSTFTVTDPSADTSKVKGGVYTYSAFAIKWLVEEAGTPIIIEHTPYLTKDFTTTDAEGKETVGTKLTTPDSIYVDGEKIDLVGKELTYYVFPVYAIDAPLTSEIKAEDILFHLYGSKLVSTSFDAFKEEYKNGDDTVESLLKEISMIFDTKSTVEGNTYYKENGALYQLNKTYNDAVTAGGSKPTDAQQDAIDTAKDALTNAQNELLKAAIAKLVVLKNGEKVLGDEIFKYNGGEDVTKVYSGEYYEGHYHSLKESYDSDIIKKVQTAVWDLIDSMVTVNVDEIPADLIKEYVDNLYESYEYDFYKGNYVDPNSSSSSSTSTTTTTNYDHFGGSFDRYLNKVVLKIDSANKVDKTALNKALTEEAQEYLVPIIKIFKVAKACEEDALKVVDGKTVYESYVQQDIDGGAYNVDREYYDELYPDDDKAEKKYNEAVKNAEENKQSSLDEAKMFLINDAFMKNYKKEVGRVNYNSVIDSYGEINVRTGFQFNKLFYYLTSTNIELNEHGDHTETSYKDGKLDFRTISYSIKVEAPEVDTEGGAEGGADAQ